MQGSIFRQTMMEQPFSSFTEEDILSKQTAQCLQLNKLIFVLV